MKKYVLPLIIWWGISSIVTLSLIMLDGSYDFSEFTEPDFLVLGIIGPSIIVGLLYVIDKYKEKKAIKNRNRKH